MSTCGLGHPLSDGQVLCATCGLPRMTQPSGPLIFGVAPEVPHAPIDAPPAWVPPSLPPAAQPAYATATVGPALAGPTAPATFTPSPSFAPQSFAPQSYVPQSFSPPDVASAGAGSSGWAAPTGTLAAPAPPAPFPSAPFPSAPFPSAPATAWPAAMYPPAAAYPPPVRPPGTGATGWAAPPIGACGAPGGWAGGPAAQPRPGVRLLQVAGITLAVAAVIGAVSSGALHGLTSSDSGRVGYAITTPAGWMQVPVTASGFTAEIKALQPQNPQLADAMTQAQAAGANGDLRYAAYSPAGTTFVANANIAIVPSGALTPEQIGESVSADETRTGATGITVAPITVAGGHGVEVQGQLPVKTSSGVSVTDQFTQIILTKRHFAGILTLSSGVGVSTTSGDLGTLANSFRLT